MSTLKVNTIKNASDVEMYLCKAWVNFNGTGTVAIRASGNVSSITDNGVGDYTVNFTTAMPDVNYSVNVTNNLNPAGYWISGLKNGTTPTTTACVLSVGTNAAATDLAYVMCSIHR